MGAYENAICEEGTREELIEHFLKARAQLNKRNTIIASLTAALALAEGALNRISNLGTAMSHVVFRDEATLVAREALAAITKVKGTGEKG